MTLLLMAAGSGSRYGKLKQFDDLGPAGEFLMEFSIFDALKNGFNHIVVITKQENQEFLQKHLSERINSNIKLDVLVQKIEDIPSGIDIPNERTKPWGTAHAVWTARKVIKTPFVIINADDYYGEKAFESAANFIKDQKDLSTFALVAYRLEDTLSAFGSVSRGVCTTENNKLKSIKERTKIVKKAGQIIDEESGLELDADASVSMNFWICTPLIFDYTKEYFAQFLADTNNHENKEIYLPFVAQEMMENGHVSVDVMTTKSQWFGVTYYDDKKVAVETLMQLTADGIYPSPLWQKV
jgi:UTP-glucose-1-phosphate uridylyltransferase